MPSRFNLSESLDETISTTGENLFVSRTANAPALTPYHYKDINSSFSFGSKNLELYDEDAVNNQIDNVLSPILGSDHFEPTHGSLLEFRLWEPINATTAFLMRQDVIDAITQWLGTRITILNSEAYIKVLDNNPDTEGYEIYMPYVITYNRVVGHYSAFAER